MKHPKANERRFDVWIPLYTGDYLHDTGHLTIIEHGAYLLLLIQAWSRGGELPADEERLRVRTGMERQQWKKPRGTILAFFCGEAGALRHKRVDVELGKAGRMTDQRRAAGIASAGARKEQRTPNEVLNEIPTTVATGKATEVQRNRRPSQPQSHTTSSIRLEGEPPGFADEQSKNLSRYAKAAVWKEGLATFRTIAGLQDGPARKQLGKLVGLAGKDHERILSLILRAEIEQPDNLFAWIAGALTVAPAARSAPDDPLGCRTWLARQPDVKSGTRHGEPVELINDYAVQVVVEAFVEAAGLPPSWRGNLEAIGAWLRDGIDVQGAVARAIAEQAGRMRAARQAIGSAAVFARAVRAARGAATA